jgi:hypothetical protein
MRTPTSSEMVALEKHHDFSDVRVPWRWGDVAVVAGSEAIEGAVDALD